MKYIICVCLVTLISCSSSNPIPLQGIPGWPSGINSLYSELVNGSALTQPQMEQLYTWLALHGAAVIGKLPQTRPAWWLDGPGGIRYLWYKAQLVKLTVEEQRILDDWIKAYYMTHPHTGPPHDEGGGGGQ